MKKLFIWFVLAPLLWSFVPSILTNDRINVAIKTGYADALADFMGAEVDLTLNKENNTVSKQEAIVALKEFFKTNKPLTFTIMHQGKSAREMQYAIGKLETMNGNYRVSIYTKMEGGKEVIKQLSFDKE